MTLPGLCDIGLKLARKAFPAIKNNMSTTEILDQLSRLTPAERETSRARLDALDANAPLTLEEKQLVNDRLAAYRQKPGASVIWSVAEADIRKQLGL